MRGPDDSRLREGSELAKETSAGSASDGSNRARVLVSRLPSHELTPRRVEEIRFEVLAAARKGRSLRPPTIRRKYVWVVLTTLLVITGAMVWMLKRDRIEIVAIGEVVGLRDSAASYSLREGIVKFQVPSLGRDHAFAVNAGSDSVVVHGTTFIVEARNASIRAVHVIEGKVEVRLAGRRVATVQAHQRWQRPDSIEDGRKDEDPPIRDPQPVEADPQKNADRMDTRRSALSQRNSRRARVTRRAKTGRIVARRHAPSKAPSTVNGGPPEPRESAVRTASVASRRSVSADDDFVQAWGHYRRADFRAAVAGFDQLLGRNDIDAARRSELLFWSAKCHLELDDWTSAVRRLTELLDRHPDAWHADRARALLTEMRGGRLSKLRKETVSSTTP